MDYGQPTSYLDIDEGVDVMTADGEQVGELAHVLADEGADIFDGLIVDTTRGPGGHRFVDAPFVDALYERAVVLSVTAEEFRGFPEPSANPGVIQHDGVEDSEGGLSQKLRRAWDYVSGRY